jgi:hypothetical protein
LLSRGRETWEACGDDGVSLGPNLPDRYGGSGPPYWRALASNRISNTLRRSIGSRRRSLPSSSSRVEGARDDAPAVAALAQLWKTATPSSSQQIASPSISPERAHGLHDPREAEAPVDAVAGEQLQAGSVTARHQPVAVVLDLVNPTGTAPRRSEGKVR